MAEPPAASKLVLPPPDFSLWRREWDSVSRISPSAALFPCLSPNLACNCSPQKDPAQKKWKSSVSLARVWREALMLVSGTLALAWFRHKWEWQGKSYFKGWTLLSTKPTIELSRSHLQSWGQDIFHPGRSSAVVCRLRNTPKHTLGKILKSPQEKYSKRNTPKHTEGGGQQSQHHARWKLHKARQPVGRVASFENISQST